MPTKNFTIFDTSTNIQNTTTYPIQEGQVFFATDTKRTWKDLGGRRVPQINLNSIETVDLDIENIDTRSYLGDMILARSSGEYRLFYVDSNGNVNRLDSSGIFDGATSTARDVILNAETSIIEYGVDGNPSPSGTIVITAETQNFTNPWFKFTGDGITDESTFTAPESGNGTLDFIDFTIPGSYFSSPKVITVEISEGDQVPLISKRITISATRSGADGERGPGITFRGLWSSSALYVNDQITRDVVEWPEDSENYYVVNVDTSSSGPITLSQPPSSDWILLEYFESVATDILLANDATIRKALVMGDDTGNEGIVRSNNAVSLTDGTGFYMDGTGIVRFGNPNGQFIRWNNNDLVIEGDLRINTDIKYYFVVYENLAGIKLILNSSTNSSIGTYTFNVEYITFNAGDDTLTITYPGGTSVIDLDYIGDEAVTGEKIYQIPNTNITTSSGGVSWDFNINSGVIFESLFSTLVTGSVDTITEVITNEVNTILEFLILQNKNFLERIIKLEEELGLQSSQAEVPASFSFDSGSTPSSVDEGDSFTLSYTTNNFESGTLYWNIEGVSGTINSSDFTATSGTTTVSNSSGSISIQVSNDTTTEGSESFRVNLRENSTSGAIVATTSDITINDTSLSPPFVPPFFPPFFPPAFSPAVPTYSISEDVTSINEGQTVTFTITTTDFGNGTLYWSLSGNVNASDFDENITSGPISISNDSGSFSLTANEDTTTEGSESFTVDLRTDSTSGTIVDSSSQITINDTSTEQLPDPTYSISEDVTSINEGQTVTFTITTTNFPDGDLYWSTNGGVNASDFDENITSGSISISSNSGSFSLTASEDTTTEGSESFTVDLKTGSTSGTTVDSTNSITINDTSQKQTTEDPTVNLSQSGGQLTIFIQNNDSSSVSMTYSGSATGIFTSLPTTLTSGQTYTDSSNVFPGSYQLCAIAEATGEFESNEVCDTQTI